MKDNFCDKSFLVENISKKAFFYCDEVGRGPLAGPVVSASVFLHLHDQKDLESLDDLISELRDLKITDSKKLTDKKRKKILEALNLGKLKTNKEYELRNSKNLSLSFCISECKPEEIDTINILQASLKSMKDACAYMIRKNSIKSAMILIDGNHIFKSGNKNFESRSLIKGDARSVFIGLASIIAKEYRDFIMEEFDLSYPGYNFSQHSGYPTKAHKEAIENLGPCPIHRKSFKGVKEFLI